MSDSKKVKESTSNGSASLDDITVEEASAKKVKQPKKKSGDSGKIGFFSSTVAEFKKIIWPSRNTLFKQTTAVVVSSIILGAIIYLVDMIIKFGIDKLVQ